MSPRLVSGWKLAGGVARSGLIGFDCVETSNYRGDTHTYLRLRGVSGLPSNRAFFWRGISCF